MIPLTTLWRESLYGLFAVVSIGGILLLSTTTNKPAHPLPHNTTPFVTEGATVIIPTREPEPLSQYSEEMHPDKVIEMPQDTTPIITSAPPTHTETPTQPVPKPVTSLTQVVTPPAIKPVVTGSYVTQLTDLITKKTNDYRATHQLQSLVADSALSTNATRYSGTMLATNNLSHTDKTGCDMSCRFVRDNYEAWSWGENLATLRFDTLPTPEYVANYFMRAWEASPDHRTNLLSPTYTTTGIGIALNSHTIYVTVQFAEPKE